MYKGYFWTREAQRERPADIRTYIHAYIHRPLWASLGLSGPLWASPGLSGPLWASLHTYVHTHIHTYIEKTRQHIHNRQLEPRPEVEDHTIADSWSPSVFRGQKMQDKKTRQGELLIKLAISWLGATRSLWEDFFRDLGPFKNAASQCMSCR